MNLKQIGLIIDSFDTQEQKENAILKVIAEDERAIPMLLQILHAERILNRELNNEMNLELSRCLVALDGKLPKDKKNFVVEQAKVFYRKWETKIKCCFKINDIP